MIFCITLLNIIVSLHFGCMPFSQKRDPCEEAKSGIYAASMFTKDSLFRVALANIKNAFTLDRNEHGISFGKDKGGQLISSPVSNGGATSGRVPAITNAFADLHNHPNDIPPDAGDFYGLIAINKSNPDYKTRFVVTPAGTVYALLVINTLVAIAFTEKYRSQPPAFAGGPPGFPVAIVDEAREMKYQHHCTNEMVLAFILDKYHAGVSLLKQHSNGAFKKIITTVSRDGGQLLFSVGNCP